MPDPVLYPLRWLVTSLIFQELPCARRWCGRPATLMLSIYCRRHTDEIRARYA